MLYVTPNEYPLYEGSIYSISIFTFFKARVSSCDIPGSWCYPLNKPPYRTNKSIIEGFKREY